MAQTDPKRPLVNKTNYLMTALSQQPYHHFGVSVGRVPGVVVNAGEFGVAHIAGR